MRVSTAITLEEITRADLVNLDDSENFIIEQALQAAGEAILKLEDHKMNRLIRFCQIGKFL